MLKKPTVQRAVNLALKRVYSLAQAAEANTVKIHVFIPGYMCHRYPTSVLSDPTGQLEQVLIRDAAAVLDSFHVLTNHLAKFGSFQDPEILAKAMAFPDQVLVFCKFEPQG